MPDQAPPQAKRGVKAARHRPEPPRAPAAASARMRVVAIGASSGGLEACTKLLDALPTPTGMAFVLVQHLDPTHPSLLVQLLAEHTALTVLQAENGMIVTPEHLYIIPPGAYLSINDGSLRLSPPNAPRGARLPFDFLLQSLATEYGGRAMCTHQLRKAGRTCLPPPTLTIVFRLHALVGCVTHIFQFWQMTLEQCAREIACRLSSLKAGSDPWRRA